MAKSQPVRKDQEIIVAYGFDKAGLSVPQPVDRPEYRIEGVAYGSSELPLTATGLILPSGIFERVSYHHSVIDDSYATVDFDRPSLLAIERYVANLLHAGGWVGILAREIIDEFAGGRYQTFQSLDSDLAKRLLSGVKRRPFRDGTGVVRAKRDEFAPYINRWGIARTFFEPHDARVLATAGDEIVGFEYGARVFVLPFLATNNSAEEATALAEVLVRAVREYRRKMLVALPEWAAEFQFAAEEKSRTELIGLRKQLLDVESGLEVWEERKSILVRSGTPLKDALIEILENFFGIEVDPIDEGREDFKVLDGKSVVVVGEAKGTNGGIKREHVNQVDSHRERLGVNDDTPGLLLINAQMDVAGIAKRREAQVAVEQVRHARRLNVVVWRTIDLLYVMRHLEGDADRRNKFLTLVRGGGGWLYADAAGYRLITGDERSEK